MAFSAKQIQEAWNRAKIVDGYDPARFRQDACGAWIIRDRYGDTDSAYGWEIDHIVPRTLLSEKGYSQDAVDNPANLRALQHENNVCKGEDYPSYTAMVTSEGTRNINFRRDLIVNVKKQEVLKGLYKL